jgi:hypothetical protein
MADRVRWLIAIAAITFLAVAIFVGGTVAANVGIELRLPGWLHGSRAHAADVPPTPPLQPDGETPAQGPPSPEVARCISYLQLVTSRTHQHIDRSLVTQSSRWGTIFRADISSTADGTTVSARFVCPTGGPGPHPVEISFLLDTPPLASGPWGDVTVCK